MTARRKLPEIAIRCSEKENAHVGTSALTITMALQNKITAEKEKVRTVPGPSPGKGHIRATGTVEAVDVQALPGRAAGTAEAAETHEAGLKVKSSKEKIVPIHEALALVADKIRGLA